MKVTFVIDFTDKPIVQCDVPIVQLQINDKNEK